ncbi:MAG: hypothetical protein IJ588_09730 [Prevotella sp.]|nr:hypothetical protein [Prevotella sp.]
MASLDEEFLKDEEETRREIQFIREQLPSDLKEKYTDAQLTWMLDAIADYFFESGILETDDDEVDIDMDRVADYLCHQAQEDGQPALSADEVRFVVEADLDFQEQNA